MRKTDASSKKLRGDLFEQEVAGIYEMMGYEVHRHIPLSGQEVDILATRYIPGGGMYSIIVECKYKGGKALSANADVQSIAGAYSISKASSEVSACTLVTTNGFSLAAQQAAKAAGIHLATKQELIKNLIDFSPYLAELKARYIEDFGKGDETWYIHPRGRKGKEEIESLDGFIDGWLKQKKHLPLVILGGYGTGKSSFCRHYAVHLINKSADVIPIIIQLRDFQKAIKIESLIRDFLDEQCRASAPRFDTFWRMYREGFLLLMFDGFDEMAVRVDKSVLEMNLVEMERFARTKANIIMTCRPEFFITKKEQAFVLNPTDDPISERMAIYESIEMELWSAKQVTQYVEKRVKSTKPRPVHPPEYYIHEIQQLPELADMSTRAVHLDLIVKMLPNMIDKGIPITRPNLYQAYIERELRRETIQNKRLELISDSSRLDLMRAVATDRFFGLHDDLNFETASRIVQEKLELHRSEVEPVTRDFLNRSFLHRIGDTYQFAHKSIGEYLFALEIYDRLAKQDLEIIRSIKYSSAVAGMVLDMFGGLEGFGSMLITLRLDSHVPLIDREAVPRIFLVCMSLADFTQSAMSAIRNELWGKPTEKQSRRIFELIHDLKNHIAQVIAYSERANKHALFSPDQGLIPKELDKISIAWGRILSLTQQLKFFYFNRLNSKLSFEVQRTNVDIADLIRTAMVHFPEGKARISGNCKSYVGDRDMLLRVFENIISNAEYAIKNGGNLVIHLSDDVDNNVRVAFSNTGPQISPEHLNLMFEFRFSTSDAGYGVGLDIVKDLIELHNGSISVTSDSRETIFEILLPRN